MKPTKQQLIYAVGFLLAGLLIGYLLFGTASHEQQENDHQHTETSEQRAEVWTCSMHPSVREDGPGSCPICGMDLIRASSEAREDDYSMTMTEAAMKLANIQTVPVERRVPEKELHLPGRIKVDERRISYVTTHFEGRIRDVRIDFTGAPIRKGEVMATIYSPELISAQRELLEAARQKERNPRLYEAAKRKFKLWEFTDEQIRQIEESDEVKNEMEILSPVNGFVIARNAVNEQHVMEGSVIYEVANLDHVWVVLEAYEQDISWISNGDAVRFNTRSHPGHTFEATVSYIDPVVDGNRRTIGVRADLENTEGHLKPDMLVQAQLHGSMGADEQLMVPASAVLWTGKRSLVYVRDASADTPRFEVKEVTLGSRTGNFYVIEEGLEEDMHVVFNGAFRLDSEMQLADRFSMMNREPGSGAVPVHDHGSMNGNDQDHVDYSEEISRDPGETMDGVSDDFKEDFESLIRQYLNGKEALFASDTEAVREAFREMMNELEAIGLHRMQGDAHMRWMEHYETIEGHLQHIIGAESIDMQREGFSALSDVLIEAVNSYGIFGVIYHQYCPMVDANWLSDEESIQNPYAPDSMPSCGEVIERIE